MIPQITDTADLIIAIAAVVLGIPVLVAVLMHWRLRL